MLENEGKQQAFELFKKEPMNSLCLCESNHKILSPEMQLVFNNSF